MQKLKPTKHNMIILHQLCNLIPPHLVSKFAREHGVDKKARSFTAWSHVISLLCGQLVHAISLNDICDSLRHHGRKLLSIRGAKAPAKNTLSHASKNRDSAMMEALFWKTLEHLQSLNPRFGPSGRYRKLPHRFKASIHAIDSSTISLVARCISWAKHRRRKAAAKLHLRLNLQTFLPSFAIIKEAASHDKTQTIALCRALKPGEIAIFDKAYVHFEHLNWLNSREVYWVTRAKDNMQYRVYRKLLQKPHANIIRDDLIHLAIAKSRHQYPGYFRRVDARGRAIKILLSPGNRNDILYAPDLIEELTDCIILADKAYDVDSFRKLIKEKNSQACISSKENRIHPENYHLGFYKKRHHVEKFFQRIKEKRIISTRYEKKASRFLDMVHLAAILDWIS